MKRTLSLRALLGAMWALAAPTFAVEVDGGDSLLEGPTTLPQQTSVLSDPKEFSQQTSEKLVEFLKNLDSYLAELLKEGPTKITSFTDGEETPPQERPNLTVIYKNFMDTAKEGYKGLLWRRNLCQGRMAQYGLNVTNNGEIKMSEHERQYREAIVETILLVYDELFSKKARFGNITFSLCEDPQSGEKYYELSKEPYRIGDSKSWIPLSIDKYPSLLPDLDQNIWDAVKSLFNTEEGGMVLECRQAFEICKLLLLIFFSPPEVGENITKKTYLGNFLYEDQRGEDQYLKKVYFNQTMSFYRSNQQKEGEYRTLPGDKLYFRNLPDYRDIHPFGHFQGDNVLFVGFNDKGEELYVSFGETEPQTAESIFKKLVDAYMAPPTELEKKYQKMIGQDPFKESPLLGLDKNSLIEEIKKAQGPILISRLEVPSTYHYQGKELAYVDFNFEGV